MWTNEVFKHMSQVYSIDPLIASSCGTDNETWVCLATWFWWFTSHHQSNVGSEPLGILY